MVSSFRLHCFHSIYGCVYSTACIKSDENKLNKIKAQLANINIFSIIGTFPLINFEPLISYLVNIFKESLDNEEKECMIEGIQRIPFFGYKFGEMFREKFVMVDTLIHQEKLQKDLKKVYKLYELMFEELLHIREAQMKMIQHIVRPSSTGDNHLATYYNNYEREITKSNCHSRKLGFENILKELLPPHTNDSEDNRS